METRWNARGVRLLGGGLAVIGLALTAAPLVGCATLGDPLCGAVSAGIGAAGVLAVVGAATWGIGRVLGRLERRIGELEQA